MKWLPLESNPDVLNKFIYKLGVKKEFEFVDVWGFEPELLAVVPQPVMAVVLLYPLTEKTKSKEIGKLDSNHPGLYFMKQTISNACGTIGLIHALLNPADHLGDDGVLKMFYQATKSMTPSERAIHLEKDVNIESAHDETAQEGQTEAPNLEDRVNCHFISFIQKDGFLYELDGRKDAPVNHGATSAETLLQDAVSVVKQFMSRDPDEMQFTVQALVHIDA